SVIGPGRTLGRAQELARPAHGRSGDRRALDLARDLGDDLVVLFALGDSRTDLVAQIHLGPGDVVAHALALADPVEVGLLGRGESGRRRASPVTRSAGAVPTACAAAGAVTALCVRILIRVV